MREKEWFANLERTIVQDASFSFTVFSFLSIVAIFLNLSFVFSPLIGAVASTAYLVINTVFLGHAFFEDENRFLRFMMGSLALILVLGLVSWIMMITYDLDVSRTVIALVAVTTLSSLMNRRATKHTRPAPQLPDRTEKTTNEKPARTLPLGLVRALYLIMVIVSFYLLFSARSGEAYIVWWSLPRIAIPISLIRDFILVLPFFLLAFFVSTFLLLTLIFSSEKTHHKLFFIILHSILSHSLIVILFPAGDLGVQQVVLGVTRRIYENTTLYGYGHSSNILVQIYYWISGFNFQSANSVVFARIFSVDVFWSHLLLVPILWGTFVPIITFKIARTLGGNEIISTLSSLAISAFPTTIYWGTFSVPNSLGFFFAFVSLYFILKYLSSPGKRSFFLMSVFSFASLLSHYLTGIIVFSLLLLATAFKNYKQEKSKSPMASKYMIITAFMLSASILPMALTYYRFLSPLYASFSLDKLTELSPIELVGSFMIGEYFFYSPLNMIFNFAAPMLGIIGIILVLRTNIQKVQNNNCKSCLFFLFSSFLLLILDYRILKFFMVGVPFSIERIWVFRDFILAPYLTILGLSVLVLLLHRRRPEIMAQVFTPTVHFQFFSKVSLKSVLIYTLVLVTLSSWITSSLYYAYPHYAPLQTTSYEIEAVQYIQAQTPEKYVVIADQWIIFAGQMFVGLYNPNAYYFAHTDPKGIRLYLQMKNNTSAETMIEAMKVNNATVAYFIVEKPRLGTDAYTHIINQAQQKNLQTYPGGIFYYKGEEKLRIFYYTNSTE